MNFEGHLYLDLAHPVTAWAAALGAIESAAHATNRTGSRAVSMLMAGALGPDNVARLNNELAIDVIRRERFPQCVSRLDGLFVFDEPESALAVAEWGGHFAENALVDVDVIARRTPTRVDANWYTFAPQLDTGDLDPTALSWIDDYWSGKAYPGRTPVWEVIVDGAATIRESEVIEEAMARTLDEFPTSTFHLICGRIGTRIGIPASQVLAFLTDKGVEFDVSFYINDGPLHTTEFAQKSAEAIKPDERAMLLGSSNEIRLPDFSRFTVKLPKA